MATSVAPRSSSSSPGNTRRSRRRDRAGAQGTGRANGRRALTVAAPTRDPIILAAGIVGLLVSAYLATIDLGGGSTLCLVGSDCDAVRASAFGHVAGLPVAVLGVAYFLAVTVTAGLRTRWQPGVLPILGGIGLGAALAFVGVQGLVLKAWCPYCLVADVAALAIGVRALWPGRSGLGSGRMMRGVVGAALALAVLVGGYGLAPDAAPAGAALDSSSTTVNGASGSFSDPGQLAALADHLRTSGAVFYGAYWCPHCQAQKQMFGAAATSLPYVECDPRGTGANPAACDAAGVRAYPTWVIGGQKMEGEIQPAELARLSGFGD